MKSSKDKKASRKKKQNEETIFKKIVKEKSFNLTEKNRIYFKTGKISIKLKHFKVNNLNVEQRKLGKTIFKNKNLINNQIFNDQQTLDLMESSWGEKFSKIHKNSIINGTNKIEISLKPKNLGKINVDIIC